MRGFVCVCVCVCVKGGGSSLIMDSSTAVHGGKLRIVYLVSSECDVAPIILNWGWGWGASRNGVLPTLDTPLWYVSIQFNLIHLFFLFQSFIFTMMVHFNIFTYLYTYRSICTIQYIKKNKHEIERESI